MKCCSNIRTVSNKFLTHKSGNKNQMEKVFYKKISIYIQKKTLLMDKFKKTITTYYFEKFRTFIKMSVIIFFITSWVILLLALSHFLLKASRIFAALGSFFSSLFTRAQYRSIGRSSGAFGGFASFDIVGFEEF